MFNGNKIIKYLYLMGGNVDTQLNPVVVSTDLHVADISN